MTLRWRLSIALVAIVLIGSVTFALIARATVERLLFNDLDRELRGEAIRMVDEIRGARGGNRFGPPGRPGAAFDDRPGRFFGRGALIAQVLADDGSVLLRTSAVDAIGGLPEPELDRDEDEHLRTAHIDDERYRIVEAATPSGAVVQVARPLSDLAGFLDTLLWVLAAAGLAATCAAIVLGPWAARATLRPVERMTRTARRIARTPRDLSTRIEPAFPDTELREFADALNEMLDSIAEADRHQRSFVADASHELRTPLTSLAGNARYLERAETLDGEDREALAAVSRDVDRLVRIADGLTMLARLDAAPTPQLEPVDVDAQVRTSLDRARSIHAGHAYTSSGTAGVHVLDAELLRRIVDNLVDNAGRYTPAGTSVLVELASSDDGLRIVVADDGPGVADDEHRRLTERFHRGSTAAGTSGTGLGLAIVAEAARSLGGELELQHASPHGLRCIVQLRSTAAASG